MTNAAPAVSVVVATYNWSAALACALEAILLQTKRDFEVLVVGDACTDDSEAVVAGFADPRLRWINLQENCGSQWGPNNEGIARAAGAWIAYCGHDDIWHPTHLEHMVAVAAARGARAVVAGMLLYGPVGSGVVQIAGLPAGHDLSTKEFVPPSGLMHRRDLVDEIGPWSDAKSIAMPVDIDFEVRIHAVTTIAATRELTVFKWNAATRRDSYLRKTVDEQKATLALIKSGTEFRYQALMGALGAFARSQLGSLSMPITFALPPGELSRLNRRAKGLEPRFEAVELRRVDRPMRFDMTGIVFPYEWHGVEHMHGGQTFRWSGPATRSTIDLPVIPDKRLAIETVLVAAITAETLETLEIFIDERPVDFTRALDPDGVIRLAMTAEASAADNLGVSFQVARTVRPCDISGSADVRWLGIAVRHIDIRPATGDGQDIVERSG